jgi:phosphoribosylamine--glycine ligase
MEKVGILVVSYGARAASMIDAFSKSEEYEPKFFVADKQKNPFNFKKSEEHVVIPDLNILAIADFADKHKDKIDFGIVGPEGPIVAGVRNVVEEKTKIPMICPKKEFAIEGSKILQREIIKESYPEANPKYKIFDPKEYSNKEDVKKDVWKWLDKFDNQVAVKPDTPAVGKGVGVWGDHFKTREELFEHFLTIFDNNGRVLIEEKIDGEEFSLQFFSDGRHLVHTPCVRDYKRAFEDDKGPNTGGMGSYKDSSNILPFMQPDDWKDALNIGRKIFLSLRGDGDNPGLWGVPLYMAYCISKDGLKVFEINSRPGMPEAQNLFPVLKNDFVKVCFDIIDGKLAHLDFEPKATVVTYKVPPTYGGKEKIYVGNGKLNLSLVSNVKEKYGDNIRIYPCSVELRDDEIFALKSRTICSVGIGDDIESAREISIEGLNAIKDGSLWYRNDIASKEHIQKSIDHVKQLRG